MVALAMPECDGRTLPTKAGASSSSSSPAPVLFLYNHLHDAIRAELDALSSTVLSLDACGEGEEVDALLRLKERYRFLEQVYKYHSAVEDEVVYPALDSKVKNVTSAYSVEHQDEEYLFEQLGQLLGGAVAQSGAARAATVRQLVCKVEAIHTTLRKHLAKEEAQLLPLLLAHFSHPEQAELVAQFLYCIPLDTVERVVTWLRPAVPARELQQLLGHLGDVVPDNLLLQLLAAWLSPPGAAAAVAAGAAAGATGGVGAIATAAAAAAAADGVGEAAGGAAGELAAAAQEAWPPLQGIVLFHESIMGALEAFATEAAALQAAPGGVGAGQLAGLVERHRFLRSVCAFHTHSEEEVMFPEVMRLSQGGGDAGAAGAAGAALQAAARVACGTCQREHAEEVSLFEELGRLLADVRALARRGRREAGGMLGQLVGAARRVCAAISVHMRREEADVLPLLAAALAPERQRAMVWRTLRAMPLRLLERVMPWLVAKILRVASLDGAPADGAAPRKRPRLSSADGGGSGGGAGGAAEEQPRKPRWLEEQQAVCRAGCAHELAVADAAAAAPAEPVTSAPDAPACGGSPSDASPHACAPGAAPSQSAAAPQQEQQQQPPPPPPSPLGVIKQRQAGCGVSPIDHIFQFHKALRQELRQLEADAADLEAAVFAGPAGDGGGGGDAEDEGGAAERAAFRQRYSSALQQLDGRFKFLWGIYRAHSRSEDEIVFPALESKEALHNEENLFTDLAAIISQMQQTLRRGGPQGTHHPQQQQQQQQQEAAGPTAEGEPGSQPAPAPAAAAAAAASGGDDVEEVRELVLQLRRMCAAVRASLETHVRAEEAELWPLFAEHFTFEEQQHLVGVIIGRTGAEVLQALLPWVTGSFSEEEAGAMMESLRAATRNTSFDRWLGATMTAGAAGGGGGSAAAAAAAPAGQQQEEQQEEQGEEQERRRRADLDSSLAEIAEYLVAAPPPDDGPEAAASPPAGGGCAGCGAGASGAPRRRAAPQQLQEASGTVAESSSYRPGWEEIFNINQKQLEAAIRRVSNDPSLEPQRKAYLIQNIMVSRYIVANQRRMRAKGTPAATPQVAPRPGSPPPAAPALTLPAGAGQLHERHQQQQQQQQQQREGEGQGQQQQQRAAVAAAVASPAPARRRHARTYHDEAAGVLGCRHYRRSARLVAPCCGEVHTCSSQHPFRS
ncbi:hypothetical protein MNEG_9490 [Monoraphidium neglectum]|uniref:CHY-type domain-containing protein n=1 Tax=Monoraphidium neglectum TaxID=145388 RepID=A0A0D2MCB8_9CHLO|nr:hypothetical protein MNEG_9490 [Monoraphidium neglectum]KIY98471.1 hypothetical protein MNEG_9490 [Monoraphidium neglectum]|eukprot:XP_013897491.1 hypothetical protein MNEG_9490 [Monoraphidium neglectum]